MEYYYSIKNFTWNESFNLLSSNFLVDLNNFPNKGKQFFIKNTKTGNFRRFRLKTENNYRFIFESEDNILCRVDKSFTSITERYTFLRKIFYERK